MSSGDAVLPGEIGAAWLPSSEFPHMPARYHAMGRRYKVPPILLVVHSGARAAGVAEYIARPDLERKVSAHFSWSSKHQGFAQQVGLDRQAWHAGGSKWRGKGGVNALSVGVELPGPWDMERGPDQRQEWDRLMMWLVQACPSLEFWARHSDIKRGKLDPGPGWDAGWMSGVGLAES